MRLSYHNRLFTAKGGPCGFGSRKILVYVVPVLASLILINSIECFGTFNAIASILSPDFFKTLVNADPSFFVEGIRSLAVDATGSGLQGPESFATILKTAVDQHPVFPLAASMVLGPMLATEFTDSDFRVAENEHFIEQLTRAIPDILYLYDFDERRLIYLNQRASSILGYDAWEFREMGERLLESLVHPTDLARLHTWFSKVNELQDGEIFEHEFRVRHKRGEWRWFHSREGVFRRTGSGRLNQILAVAHDITERKYIEEALVESESRNASILKAIPDLMFLQHEDGTYLEYYANDPNDLLVAPEIFLGKNLRDVLPADIVNDVLRAFEKTKKTGSPQSLQYGMTINGDEKIYECRMVRSGRDKILSIVRDITEQKGIEEKLLKKESFFRSLVENAHDIIDVLRLDGTIVYESPACEAILGYAPDERIGDDCLQYIHPDDLPRVRSLFHDLVEDGGVAKTVEYRYRRKSGAYVTFEVTGRVSIDENGEPIVIVNKRDMTDRRTIEAKLGASEALYRNVVETQTEMICRFLPDSTLTFVNDAYCRFFRRSREQLVGRKFFELIPEDKSREAQEFVRSLVESRTGADCVEHEVIQADGSIGWHQWSNHLVLDDLGNVIELQGIGRDITERKLAEKQLQNLSAKLLNLQDDERRRLARELHDGTAQNLATLNINLSTVKQLLREDQEKALALLEQSEMLNRESLREVRTLSYLLHPPMLDDNGLASALRWLIRGFSERSGVSIDLVFDPSVGRLQSEVETALYRIVQEGLNNIHRHSKSSTAQVRVVKESNHIVLEVFDQGRGIPESLLTNSDAYSHTLGVGIPGMRERVRLLGGELRIESDVNGTALRCFIPFEGDRP